MLRCVPVQRDRSLQCHALRGDADAVGHCYDCFHLDARCVNAEYEMTRVTGLDYSVLSTLVGQAAVPALLLDVVLDVERLQLTTVRFRCQGGTHRSVGMCYLLLLLIYRSGTFVPSTDRALAAAERFWLRREPLARMVSLRTRACDGIGDLHESLGLVAR